ncbi:hypothetical protein LCGC14_1389150 [marine sediment metagenome]|uniref:Uncharacterized protein n=1 Tax=marine sediment metagenome TaxID=412755 RepID=A0A0F9MFZ7_9ZZZZ
MVQEEPKKERYIVEEVPTQTAIVIRDTETKEQFSIETALVKILNNQAAILEQIK